MSDLRKLNIDGTEYEVPAEYTLMQACEEFGGAEIPRWGTAVCVLSNGSVRQSRKRLVRYRSKICVRTVTERPRISVQIPKP